MKPFLFILLYGMILTVSAQVQISGIVETESGDPVTGANVYLQGSYDGGTTDSGGVFSFMTTHSGSQILIASFIGFVNHTRDIYIDGELTGLKIVLFTSFT